MCFCSKSTALKSRNNVKPLALPEKRDSTGPDPVRSGLRSHRGWDPGLGTRRAYATFPMARRVMLKHRRENIEHVTQFLGLKSHSNSFHKYTLFGNLDSPRFTALMYSSKDSSDVSGSFQHETEDATAPVHTTTLAKALSCDPILSARISHCVKGDLTANIFKARDLLLSQRPVKHTRKL